MVKSLNHSENSHNPYFNRLTFAIPYDLFIKGTIQRHNPYFNRLTFAIKEKFGIQLREQVTILILID